MMYPFVKYSDGTEVMFSNVRKKKSGEEYIKVSFERATEKGFDTLWFELPSYDIVRNDGEYTEEEVEMFKEIIENCADLFYKYAQEGGMQIA